MTGSDPRPDPGPDSDEARAFWSFSWALYHQPGVEAACLRLQDRDGLDVNILLLCCFLGTRGILLSADDVGRIAEDTRIWRDAVIAPLRNARRAAKPLTGRDVQAFRKRLKQLELDGERLAQSLLLAAAHGLGETVAAPARSVIARNLHTYPAAVGMRGRGHGDLERLGQAAVDNAAAVNPVSSV